MSTRAHWEQVYQTKAVDGVSWYRPHLERSLAYLRDAQLAPDAALIDVGGGASTFVDDALALGFRDITVLDMAEAAHWYRLSAGNGDARAQLLLGNLYNAGQGVPRDAVAAYALYRAYAGRPATSAPRN